jgi:GNAT superfamily N-acetyltransferase
MVTFRTFQTQDSPAVRDLFARGLADFAAGYEVQVDRYIQQSLDDDLADIDLHYLASPDDYFWVADIDGAVKGMVGVQRRSDEEAELRRMSVASDARRQGIGLGLLETVEAFCREKGHRRIALTTVTFLVAAIPMYERFGFRLVGEEPYGLISAQHYVKELGP